MKSLKRVIGVPAVALLAFGGAAFATVATSAPAGAVTVVHDATELQNAFDSTEQQIVLANDINVTAAIQKSSLFGDPVTIDGAGFSLISDGSDRILDDQAGGLLTLQNITLTGGVVDGDGGAVYAGGAVTLLNATFVDNEAYGSGGAVYSANAALTTGATATGSAFSGNVAHQDGGAISVEGPLTVTGSTFSGNTAESDGGALHSIDGPIEIDGSTFTQNQADSNVGGYGDGGAAYTQGDMTVTGSAFTGNFTNGDQDFGGGALEALGQLDISDSEFTGNSAYYVGGAAYSEGDMTIARSTFTGNCAQYGGAIEHNIGESEGSAALSIVNSTITGNTQVLGDSAIGGFGASLDIAYSTIVGNINDSGSTCGLPDTGGKALDAGSGRAATGGVGGGLGASESGLPANLVSAGPLTIFGTLVTGPVNGINCDISDGTDTQGYNFSDDTTCELTDSTDRVATPNDPQLNALGAWGGPTPTMLPFTPLHGGATSPLIDAIPAAACQTGIAAGIGTDQRGVTRPQLVGCDIGAVEVTGAELQVEAAVIQPRFTG